MAPPVTPLVPLFPSPRITFKEDGKLQGAINTALGTLGTAVKESNKRRQDAFDANRATHPKDKPPIPLSTALPFSFAIIDLGSGNPLKYGAYNGDHLHYIASGAKLAALYAAFALRDMVKRFSSTAQFWRGVDAMLSSILHAKPGKPVPLTDAMVAIMNPGILAAAPPAIQAAAKGASMVPSYDDVFLKMPPGSSAAPDFRGDFKTALHQMIVPSDNDAAGRCIRGVGYAYINGALDALHLPSKKGEPGVWLAGDYVAYHYVYVNSLNDGLVAQAGSALAMAQLMALIVNDGILEKSDCDEMKILLKQASEGIDVPFMTRASIPADWRVDPRTKVTHAKLGRGPLKLAKGSKEYDYVVSETFRLSGYQKAKNYVIVFQNVDGKQTSTPEVALMLHQAIELYEK